MDAKKNMTADKEDEVPGQVNYYSSAAAARFFRPGDDEKSKKTTESTNQTGAKKSRVSYENEYYVDDEEGLQEAISYSIQPQPDCSSTRRLENQMEVDYNSCLDRLDEDANMETILSDDDENLQRVLLLSMSSFHSEEQQRKPDRKLKGVAASPVLKPLYWYRYNEFSAPLRGDASTSSYVKLSVCTACNEYRPPEEMDEVFDCKHRFCPGCVRNTLYGLIKSDIFKITCPAAECDAVCDFGMVYRDAPLELKRRWFLAYKETKALGKPRWVNCTYFKCDKKFLWDYRSMIKACPDCGGLLCVRCKVSYHNHFGLTCAEYQAREEARKPEEERQRLIVRILSGSGYLDIRRRRGEGDENEADEELE